MRCLLAYKGEWLADDQLKKFTHEATLNKGNRKTNRTLVTPDNQQIMHANCVFTLSSEIQWVCNVLINGLNLSDL